MNILKHLIIACSLCLPALTTMAQTTSRPVKVNGGIRVGLNLSKLDGENWESGYRSNILGGAFLRVHNNRVGIQVEGYFSQVSYTTGKDFKSLYGAYVDSAKTALDKGTLQVSYFNIPILFQVKLLPRVWIQAGPQYSGVVSVNDKDNFFKDAEAVIKKGALSGVGGIWIDLPLHLNIGARYVMAFSRFDNNDIDASWKQRNVQIHAGLTF